MMMVEKRMSHMLKLSLIGISLLLCTSCVTRTLTIESTPPGARVFMERKDIGTTPITIDIEYGGAREFLLLHEVGETKYAPVRIHHDSEEFFLDTFPFDVLTLIQPIAIERNYLLQVTLEESTLLDLVLDDPKNYVAALLDRADQMRRRAKLLQDSAGEAKAPFLDDGKNAEKSQTEPSPPVDQENSSK